MRKTNEQVKDEHPLDVRRKEAFNWLKDILRGVKKECPFHYLFENIATSKQGKDFDIIEIHEVIKFLIGTVIGVSKSPSLAVSVLLDDIIGIAERNEVKMNQEHISWVLENFTEMADEKVKNYQYFV